jgi:hypothetical protein
MALLKFITKQSTAQPSITDFYTRLTGAYGSFGEVDYTPNTAEYTITQLGPDQWCLFLEEAIISATILVDLTSKNILDIEFNTFPALLEALVISNNIIPSANLDKIIHYLATASVLGQFLINGWLITTGNTEIRTPASQPDIDILISRLWDIEEDVILPTPTPTPTITPTVTRSGNFAFCGTKISQILQGNTRRKIPISANTTKIVLYYTSFSNPDRYTITQGAFSATTGFVGSSEYDEALKALNLPPVSGPGTGSLVFEVKSQEEVYLLTESPLPNGALEYTIDCISTPNVETVAGVGIPADFIGNINSNRCDTSFPLPTPTPSITPTKYTGPAVITVGGSRVFGDKDGSTCLVTPTPSKQRPYVETIAKFCDLPRPSSTPTITPSATFKGPKVITVGGTLRAGRFGDQDGTEIITDPFPTPTPSTTPPTVGSGNLGGASTDPEPEPSPTPTETPTPTPTVTPSETSTPTPTPSVTPTLTPTVHCVVPKPKNEEPCCKEPAIVEGHGSTTFNSRVTSYVKLLNRCKSALGYPLIQLEITDEQIYNFIDVSLEFFTKFGGYTEEYLVFKSTLYKRGIGLPIGDLFSITPELANSLDPVCPSYPNMSLGQDIDMDERRKVMDVFTVQPGDNSGINTLFTIEQTIAQQAYFGHLLGNVGFDLITFDVLKMWLKTREKVLALKPSYRFYPERQLLRITPEPIATTPYFGIIGAYVQKPIRELISQLWIYKYTMAQIKVTMGHIRGKSAGTGLYGGQTVNYTDLMSQGIKEMDELEKELKTDLIDREPIPFFLG